MEIPTQPITLAPEQIEDLSSKLSHLRHNINNHLALISAAAELIRFKPEMRERMATTLGEQPGKIMAELAKFSTEFDQAFGIRRGS